MSFSFCLHLSGVFAMFVVNTHLSMCDVRTVNEEVFLVVKMFVDPVYTESILHVQTVLFGIM